ncbi:beta-class phenol-soluble modulin [Corynebacterium poyangense]|uniref:Beta-class phenol-soluble modulin n=1 Tax=Corynebacterium poyangense TaxID=2684405 RepID=A0A7H0SP69_9CORY|nr:beta-class phenol-soluble modulin [Corynebacterium poyangense]MBZ8177913.1 beta-class phenol-soluble modulin [Corynebacterium poyangense]QNQ90344.1 beta-class phenol-soluble modulin [Corynebacterium poyangense]
MADHLQALGESIVGIVTSAISGDWGALAKSIIGTVTGSLDLGSSVIEGSSQASDTAGAGADAAAAAK